MMDQASRNAFSLYPSTMLNNYAVNQPEPVAPSNVNAESVLVDVLRGNGEPVVCMSVSENGVIIVSGCADGRAYVWRTDVGDGVKLYCELAGHQSYIRDVLIFYPQVLTASGDATVKKWHLPTKQLVQTWRGHDGPITVMAHLGGSVYTSSVDQTAILWDYNSGTPIARFRGHAGPVGCLSLIPTEPAPKMAVPLIQGGIGDILATGSADATVRLWNTETGQMLQVLGYFLAPAPNMTVNNPQNNEENAMTTAVLQPIADNSYHRGPITALAFVRSAQILCSGSTDCTIRGWAAPMWLCVIVLDTHSAPITRLQAPNEDNLFSGGADGAVHSWNFELTMVGRERQIVPVAHLQTTFSPFDERSSRIYNKNNYDLQQIYGNDYASSSNKVPIGHPRNPISFYFNAADDRQPVESITTFCRIGRFLVVGSMDGSVCCYDELGAIVRRLPGHTNAVTQCKSLMDRFVLTSSVDGTIRVWNRRLLFQSQQQQISAPIQPPPPPQIKHPLLLNYTISAPDFSSQPLPSLTVPIETTTRTNPMRVDNNNLRKRVVKNPVVVVDDNEDDSGTEMPDLRTIATQTKVDRNKKTPIVTSVGTQDTEVKKKPKERIITVYREKTPPSAIHLDVQNEEADEEEEPEPKIFFVPKKVENKPKMARKPVPHPAPSTPPASRTPQSVPHPQPAVSLPHLDPTYLAMRDHQRDLALMSMAAEVAVERALRRSHNPGAVSLDSAAEGRLSLPPILPTKTEQKRTESRAWSLPSAHQQRLPRLVNNNEEDEDEYFEELDYAPSKIVTRK